jgi:hypothetical protein
MVGVKHITEIGIVFVVALSQINDKSSALAQSSSIAEDSLTPLPRFGPQVQRRTQAKASKATDIPYDNAKAINRTYQREKRINKINYH